ncbi:hypothetical protein BDU57DRAFT_515302, partial [Ampelomyces quisqualis]
MALRVKTGFSGLSQRRRKHNARLTEESANSTTAPASHHALRDGRLRHLRLVHVRPRDVDRLVAKSDTRPSTSGRKVGLLGPSGSALVESQRPACTKIASTSLGSRRSRRHTPTVAKVQREVYQPFVRQSQGKSHGKFRHQRHGYPVHRRSHARKHTTRPSHPRSAAHSTALTHPTVYDTSPISSLNHQKHMIASTLPSAWPLGLVIPLHQPRTNHPPTPLRP